MAGVKREAQAASVIIVFAFMFALLEKTGMVCGKEERRFERETGA